MGDYVWGGLAIGAVIGGGAGDDVPSGDGGYGGSKSSNDGDEGAQGLFSLWGHEVWLYIGGILGIGKTAGLYLTTGPMIGSNPDWAIGGGVHLGRALGVGVVVPIRQAMNSYSKHHDKVAAYMDQLQQGVNIAQEYVVMGVKKLPETMSLLEQTVQYIT